LQTHAVVDFDTAAEAFALVPKSAWVTGMGQLSSFDPSLRAQEWKNSRVCTFLKWRGFRVVANKTNPASANLILDI
jgi:hypothetical protein